ncbi:unnamed protein product [Aphanomyces euteiches]
MSTGIREDDISYFSFATSEISALALRTLKEAALHGGWVILQARLRDLDRLRQSDIVELSRHLEGIAEGDFTVHSDFRLWLVNNNADNLFPTCDMKSYYFDPASVVRRGFSYVNAYASPLRLRDWITWLQASVSMYQEWLWTLRCPLIRLQAFQNPQALLMTMLNMYAVAHEIPVCDLCLAACRPTLTTNDLPSYAFSVIFS